VNLVEIWEDEMPILNSYFLIPLLALLMSSKRGKVEVYHLLRVPTSCELIYPIFLKEVDRAESVSLGSRKLGGGFGSPPLSACIHQMAVDILLPLCAL